MCRALSFFVRLLASVPLADAQMIAPDTVAFSRATMPEAYRLIRVLYRFINPDESQELGTRDQARWRIRGADALLAGAREFSFLQHPTSARRTTSEGPTSNAASNTASIGSWVPRRCPDNQHCQRTTRPSSFVPRQCRRAAIAHQESRAGLT